MIDLPLFEKKDKNNDESSSSGEATCVLDGIFRSFSPKYVVEKARFPPSMSWKRPVFPQVCRAS
jgi:hypothetical protein